MWLLHWQTRKGHFGVMPSACSLFGRLFFVFYKARRWETAAVIWSDTRQMWGKHEWSNTKHVANHCHFFLFYCLHSSCHSWKLIASRHKHTPSEAHFKQKYYKPWLPQKHRNWLCRNMCALKLDYLRNLSDAHIKAGVNVQTTRQNLLWECQNNYAWT